MNYKPYPNLPQAKHNREMTQIQDMHNGLSPIQDTTSIFAEETMSSVGESSGRRMSMFQTARGSSVSYSEDAHKRGSSILKDDPAVVDTMVAGGASLMKEGGGTVINVGESSGRRMSMFQTARGSSVSYSEDAHKRGSSILKEDPAVVDTMVAGGASSMKEGGGTVINVGESSGRRMSMFQTARGSSVSYSEDAHKRGSSILKDDPAVVDTMVAGGASSMKEGGGTVINVGESSGRRMSMFQTARGSSVSYSEDAHKRGSSILKEDPAVVDTMVAGGASSMMEGGGTVINVGESSGRRMSMFQTERGSSVSYSEDAHKRGSSILKEDPAVVDTMVAGGASSMKEGDGIVSSAVESSGRRMSMFQTARGSSVSYSEDAHKRGSSILKEDPAVVDTMVAGGASSMKEGDGIVSSAVESSGRRMSMFQTARGGSVSYSEDAHKRGSSILKEDPAVVDTMVAGGASSMKEGGGTVINVGESSGRRMSMFQTARGSSVSYSEDAHKRGSSILKEDPAVVDTMVAGGASSMKEGGGTVINAVESSGRRMSMFQTERGSSVSYSEDAHKRGSSILKEDPAVVDTMVAGGASSMKEGDGIVSSAVESSGRRMSMFQTARGSSVSYSEDAHKRGSSILKEDPAVVDTMVAGGASSMKEGGGIVSSAGESSGRRMSMFQTARGSSVSYSEDAHKRGSSILKDDPAVVDTMVAGGASSMMEGGGTVINVGESSGRRMSMFQTERGSSVSYSENAHKRGSSILKEDPAVVDTMVAGGASSMKEGDGIVSSAVESSGRRMSMFQTARGSSVSYSEDAHKRGSSILKEDPAVVDTMVAGGASSMKEGGGTVINVGESSGRRMSMFQTARGSSVSYSEDAHKRGSSILKDDPAVVDTMVAGGASSMMEGGGTVINAVESSGRRMSMFQTERGSSVSYSEDAHKRGSSILKEDPAVVDTMVAGGASSMKEGDGTVSSVGESSGDRASDALKGAVVEISPVSSSPVESNRIRAATDSFQADSNSTMWYGCNYVGFVSKVDSISSVSPEFSINRSYLETSYSATVDIKSISKLWRQERIKFLSRIGSYNALNLTIDSSESALFISEEGLTVVVLEFISGVPLSAPLQQWVLMQLRWVAWTLASYERKYKQYLGSLLTASNIICAVSSRYNAYTISRSICGSSRAECKRFKGSGSQSPLQRCCDIATLTWPLCLCIALDPTGSLGVEVTDGWWWTTAILDSPLKGKIDSNKLRDGCKIIVLGASFAMESNRAVMELKINCVRKARGTSRLGFVHPTYLRRGLALSGIMPDGGSVYGASLTLVYVSPVLVKLKMRSEGEVSRQLFADKTEAAVFRHARGLKRSRLESTVENHQDLSLRSLLDAIACDESTAQLILSIDAGFQPELADTEMRELQRIYQKLQNARDTAVRGILNTESAISVEEFFYVDALMRCNISGALAWLRFKSDESGDCYASNAALGSSLFASNLKPQRSRSHIPLLITGQNTNISDSATKICDINIEEYIKMHTDLRQYLYERKYYADTHEINFKGYIISFSIKEETSLYVGYDIILVDEFRVILLLNYHVPIEAKGKLSWLKEHSYACIYFALIERFDNVNDILSCTRGDRTHIIEELQLQSCLLEIHQLESCVINEKRRFEALLRGKQYFLSFPTTKTESCSRKYYKNVSIHASYEVENKLRIHVSNIYPEFSAAVEDHVISKCLKERERSFFLTGDQVLLCDVVCSHEVSVLKHRQASEYVLNRKKAYYEINYTVVWIKVLNVTECARRLLQN